MSPRRARHGARWRGCLVVFLVLLVHVRPARAEGCGACTLSGLPTSRDLRFGLFPGELVADVSFAGTWGERLAMAHKGARRRDAGLWFENRWVALLGFTHSLGLELELPVHAAFTSARSTSPLGDSQAAHASRTGLGDTWLSLRLARPVGAWTVLATAGLSLPTGSASTSGGAVPTLEEGAEVAAASGSGTWDPLVKLALSRRLGSVELTAVGQGRFRFQAAAGSWSPGVRLFGSVGLAHVPGYRWRYGLSADVLHAGAMGTADGDAKGAQTQLLGTGFLQLRVNTWSARLSAHLPLIRWESARAGTDPNGWAHALRLQLGFVTAFDVGA